MTQTTSAIPYGATQYADGQPRSAGYPWDFHATPKLAPALTSKQLRNRKQAEYEKAKLARKKAERVNQERRIAGGPTNSERAPR